MTGLEAAWNGDLQGLCLGIKQARALQATRPPTFTAPNVRMNRAGGNSGSGALITGKTIADGVARQFRHAMNI
jgi:hypothetical protein